MSESCRVFPHLTMSHWVFLHHIVLSPPGLGLQTAISFNTYRTSLAV